MKHFLLSLLLVLFLLASSCLASNQKLLQHASSHRLFIQAGTEGWYCTGTVIGPHAILTDQHCDDDKGAAIFVALDASEADKPKTYAVSKRYFDHEDHMIMVIPALSFESWISYKPDTYLPPVQGEHVYYWGNPARHVDLYREGYTSGKGDVEIELPTPAINPGYFFILVAGPGDSGAAIYGEDGRIVSLLTGHFDSGIAAGFPLAFTPEQVAEATK